jgi:hypothetical protein
MTAAIDTSALGNALESQKATDLFAAAVLRMDAVLFVSELVIFEISSDADTKQALSRMMNLQRLCRKLGQSFCLAPDHVGTIREETHHWLRGPPALSVGWKKLERATRKELLGLTPQMPEAYKWIRDKKAWFFGKDRGLNEYVAAKGYKVNPAEIVELISSAAPIDESDMMIEMASGLSNGSASPAQIASNPKRYKATHALAHLVWRLCLANSVPRGVPTKKQEPVLGAWRTKRKGKGEGTWYDVTIAGSAAYVDVLISDDADQRARCKFLRSRGLLTFRAVKLSAFQAGSV